mgnify:CR=1 FL=1
MQKQLSLLLVLAATNSIVASNRSASACSGYESDNDLLSPKELATKAFKKKSTKPGKPFQKRSFDNNNLRSNRRAADQAADKAAALEKLCAASDAELDALAGVTTTKAND